MGGQRAFQGKQGQEKGRRHALVQPPIMGLSRNLSKANAHFLFHSLQLRTILLDQFVSFLSYAKCRRNIEYDIRATSKIKHLLTSIKSVFCVFEYLLWALKLVRFFLFVLKKPFTVAIKYVFLSFHYNTFEKSKNLIYSFIAKK